jgi:DNA-directed RNA polymerase specialized sigma24 family protein
MPTEYRHPPDFGSKQTSIVSSKDRDDGNLELAALFQSQIEPKIKKYISSKFRVTLKPDDDSRENQDALELLSETKVLLFQKLQNYPDSGGKDIVRNLDAYIKTVTTNVFNQYLRRKYPRRLSLRNQLRYLLTHHERLALWKDDADRWVCGLLIARNGGKTAERIALSDEQRRDVSSRVALARSIRPGAEVIRFVLSIFEFGATPAFFDDLVSLACEVLNIEEPTEVAEPENISELVSSSKKATPLRDIEDKEFVRILWDEIKRLPLHHRAALLLNFNDDNGESLIFILPMMRIATIRQIADTLGFNHDELAKVWNELPWDDNRIASHLGLERQNVINLRQSARQMLRRKLQR